LHRIDVIKINDNSDGNHGDWNKGKVNSGAHPKKMQMQMQQL